MSEQGDTEPSRHTRHCARSLRPLPLSAWRGRLRHGDTAAPLCRYNDQESRLPTVHPLPAQTADAQALQKAAAAASFGKNLAAGCALAYEKRPARRGVVGPGPTTAVGPAAGSRRRGADPARSPSPKLRRRTRRCTPACSNLIHTWCSWRHRTLPVPSKHAPRAWWKTRRDRQKPSLEGEVTRG